MNPRNMNPRKPRPTDAEFEILKRERDAALDAAVTEMCKKHGWTRSHVVFPKPSADDCYCDCPDGPCQHVWDGPEYVEEGPSYMCSVTCSRCGAVAAYHDMRYLP
jgi:hypothetical protein